MESALAPTTKRVYAPGKVLSAAVAAEASSSIEMGLPEKTVASRPSIGRFQSVDEAVGKSVLLLKSGQPAILVCDDGALRNSLKFAFESRALSPLVLSIDGKTTAAEICREVKRVVSLAPPLPMEVDKAIKTRDSMASRLNVVPETLKKALRDSETTGYDAVAYVVTHAERAPHEARFDDTLLDRWQGGTFNKALSIAQQLDTLIEAQGSPRNNPWRGSNLREDLTLQRELLSTDLSALQQSLMSFKTEGLQLCHSLGIPQPKTQVELEQIVDALATINNLESEGGSLLKNINFRSSIWIEEPARLSEALEVQLQSTELVARLAGKVDLKKLLNADLDSIGKVVMTHQAKNSMLRLFNSDYEKALLSLKGVVAVPKKPQDVARLVGLLTTVQEVLRRCEANRPLWNEIFRGVGGESEAGDVNFWRRQSQVSQAVQSVLTVLQDNPASAAVIECLKDPLKVYEFSGQIDQVRALGRTFTTTRNALLDSLGFSTEDRANQFDSVPLDVQEKRIGSMRGNIEGLDEWHKLGLLTAETSRLGFEWLGEEAYRINDVRPGLADGLTHAWMSSLAREVVTSKPALETFSGEVFEEMSRRFKEAQTQIRTAESFEIVSQHWAKIPRVDVGGVSAMLHSTLNEGPGDATLAQLFAIFGRALRDVKPIIICSSDQLEKVAPTEEVPKEAILRVGQGLPQEAPDSEASLSVKGASRVDPFVAHLKNILAGDSSVVFADPDDGVVDLYVSRELGVGQKKVALRVDGYNYQAASSADEREGGAIETVEGTGVPLQREWILDWYRDPKGQQARFLASITERLDTSTTLKEAVVPSFGRGQLSPKDLQPLRLEGALPSFDKIPRAKLEQAVRFVVDRSYGISQGELPRQVVRTFGYTSEPFGSREIVDAIARDLLKQNQIRDDGGLLCLMPKVVSPH